MTAKELFGKHFNGLHYDDITEERIEKYAIEFAKFHAENALNRANENVRFDYSDIESIQELILTAYPLDGIV